MKETGNPSCLKDGPGGNFSCLRGGSKKKVFCLALLTLFVFFPGRAFGFPSIGPAPQEGNDQFLPEGKDFAVEAWVEGLEIPWSLLFLAGGRALVSERWGLRAVSPTWTR